MALVGRATVWWFLGTLFLVFVVLRLDGSTDWKWFIIFTPMWLLDILSIAYLITVVVVGTRNNRFAQHINEFHVSRERAVYLITVYVAKLTFELLLCAKLDSYLTVSYFFLFIPLWIMLGMVVGFALRETWLEANHTHHQ